MNTTALTLAVELHDTYCAAGDWPHDVECVAFEGYEVVANPLLTVLAGRGYARRADVTEVVAAGLTHVRSRCDTALSFGQCILPSGHAPLFGSLPHIMADGNLFNTGDVPEVQAPVPTQESIAEALWNIQQRHLAPQGLGWADVNRTTRATMLERADFVLELLNGGQS